MWKWIFAALVPCFVQAQEALTPKERMIASENRKMGWVPRANLGLNLSFSSSQNYVGQTDGDSQTYSLNLKGGLNYNTEFSEWRNDVSLVESTTRNPSLPRFVKSGDELRYETIYLYSLPAVPEIGPYVKGEIQTSLFKGEDVRESEETYVIRRRNGDSSSVKASTLQLTSAFRPLTTKESAGFFWRPVQNEKLKIESRLGFGAMQVRAHGQYVVKKKEGNVIPVDELRDVEQAGLEAGVLVTGKIDDKSGYELRGEILTPFVLNKEEADTRSAWRLTNVEASAKLTSNITAWAAFGYDYRLRIQPQVVDRTQQIHLLVLNINYNLL